MRVMRPDKRNGFVNCARLGHNLHLRAIIGYEVAQQLSTAALVFNNNCFLHVPCQESNTISSRVRELTRSRNSTCVPAEVPFGDTRSFTFTNTRSGTSSFNTRMRSRRRPL